MWGKIWHWLRQRLLLLWSFKVTVLCYLQTICMLLYYLWLCSLNMVHKSFSERYHIVDCCCLFPLLPLCNFKLRKWGSIVAINIVLFLLVKAYVAYVDNWWKFFRLKQHNLNWIIKYIKIWHACLLFHFTSFKALYRNVKSTWCPTWIEQCCNLSILD